MLKRRQALNKLFFFYFLLAVLCYGTISYGDDILINAANHSAYILKAQRTNHETVCQLGSSKYHSYFNDFDSDLPSSFCLSTDDTSYSSLSSLAYHYIPCHKAKIRIVAPYKLHWLSGELI